MIIEALGFHLSIVDEVSGTLHRTTLSPGDSLAGQPQEVLDAAAALWTPELLAEWAALNPAPDPGEELEAWRATAFMSKANFCWALKTFGILPVEEAIAASRGEVPTSFAGIIAAMSEEDRDRAQIDWGGSANITRTNRLINDAAAAAGIPAATLDAIFGWME